MISTSAETSTSHHSPASSVGQLAMGGLKLMLVSSLCATMRSLSPSMPRTSVRATAYFFPHVEVGNS